MKPYSTSLRLKEIMSKHNLKQIDILNACKPLCNKYNVKFGKSDLSQYISGKVEPGQEKLSVLAEALKVSEAWLMGYDVPMQDNGNEVVGTRLKEQRLRSKLTLLQVANAIGVTEATVQRYESGEIKNIKHETIYELAKILQCTPSYLMGWEEKILPFNKNNEADEFAKNFENLTAENKEKVLEIMELYLNNQ